MYSNFPLHKKSAMMELIKDFFTLTNRKGTSVFERLVL